MLLLSIIPLCANIDARIEAIQNAPVEERYILMNAFKKEVVHMQETERIDAITKLRSITQSRHSDRAIKELQRHTKPRHSRSREILSKTKERTEKQFTQENEAEDHIEDETEDHIEDETEDHIEDETEDHIENETEDHIENETEDHIEDETEDHIENETEDHIEDETEDHIEDETEDHIEDETDILRMNMMMTKILLPCLMLFTLSHAQSTTDQDMDGVPDDRDQCLDTPFLNVVNDKGCSTTTLIFPEERDSGSLDVSFGYGYSIDEEQLDRDSQHTTKLQISYYLNNWSYSLRTGYFSTNDDSGMQDTTLKIKHKFKLTKSLKIGLGVGVRLPTYDFIGNNTDYTLYGSIIYYPKSALSIFAGVSHTFIQDDEIVTPLQDINTVYAGSGYFFTKDLYANIAYSYAESKFTTNDPAHSIISTLFYRINDKWFTTLSYSHVIKDELSNSASIKFGYSIW